jgi:hypothetical protein
MSKRFAVPMILVMAVWISIVSSLAAGAEAPSLIGQIKAVGPEGTGNAEAARAWRDLVGLGPEVLPDILAAFDERDPRSANWLRAAVDAIAERALAKGQPLPKTKLEAFVRSTSHNGSARRLAYEWLARVDTTAPERLLPGMLNDPAVELRRDAVARIMAAAQVRVSKGDKAGARTALQELFPVARDRDQVDQIAKDLKGLGVSVDLTAHYGFITRWMLIGPFDNTAGVGFGKVYPPETRVDLAAECAGKKDAKLHWIEFTTADTYGTVDLNKAIAKHMGAVGYGFAAVQSPAERRVELRATSNNAVKIFLNGKQVFFREEYHHGTRMDQHVGVGTLKPGRNEILIKVCQNEQKEDWAQTWGFQLRVCDALGGAVPMTVLADKPKTTRVSRGE